MTMFDQITDFNNLYAAYKAAAAGKHDRAGILRHDLHAEKILWSLRRQLNQPAVRQRLSEPPGSIRQTQFARDLLSAVHG